MKIRPDSDEFAAIGIQILAQSICDLLNQLLRLMRRYPDRG